MHTLTCVHALHVSLYSLPHPLSPSPKINAMSYTVQRWPYLLLHTLRLHSYKHCAQASVPENMTLTHNGSYILGFLSFLSAAEAP